MKEEDNVSATTKGIETGRGERPRPMPHERKVVDWLKEDEYRSLTLGVHPSDKDVPTRWIVLCLEQWNRPKHKRGARMLAASNRLGLGTIHPYPCKASAYLAVIRMCEAAGRTDLAREQGHRLFLDVQTFGYTSMWEVKP